MVTRKILKFPPEHHCWATRYIVYLRGCQNSSKSIVIYLICSNYIYCEDKERKELLVTSLPPFQITRVKANWPNSISHWQKHTRFLACRSGCKIFDFLQHRCNSFLWTLLAAPPACRAWQVLPHKPVILLSCQMAIWKLVNAYLTLIAKKEFWKKGIFFP